jgi:hypothetical protein
MTSPTWKWARWAPLSVAWALLPQRVQGCAACFGQSDSELARGMNWGIFTLLLIVVCVLAAISSFFIFLAHKAASAPAAPALPTSAESTSKQ